jgi:threonine/homoserine/homoserine lactone efflux protein
MVILGLGIVVDFTVQSLYLLAATQARAFIRSPRSMKLVNRSSAGLMAGSAALIASRG